MNTCMKMIMNVRLSRESILKIIAKASLAVLVVAGVFGTPAVHAFRNYSEYAAACSAQGGKPSPSPARCEMPSAGGGGSPGDYSGAEAAGRRARQWIDCKLFGSGCPDQTDGRQDAGHALNQQGVQAYNKGDWATAISLFQQALQNRPDDPVIRKNLANAQANMANQQEREKAEREAMDRQRQNKVAADNMQQSIQNFAQTLKAAPVAGGLDFDGRTAGAAPSDGNSGGLDFTAAIAMPSQAKPAPAVPSELPKDVENAIAGAYQNAPPGVSERVRKGFQAVMDRDWKVASAWFEDALNHDPNNAALKNLVAAARSSLPAASASPASKVTPTQGLQLPTDDDMRLLSDQRSRAQVIADEVFLEGFDPGSRKFNADERAASLKAAQASGDTERIRLLQDMYKAYDLEKSRVGTVVTPAPTGTVTPADRPAPPFLQLLLDALNKPLPKSKDPQVSAPRG